MSKIDQLDAALTTFELALTDKLLHPHPEASARFVNARGELFSLVPQISVLSRVMHGFA